MASKKNLLKRKLYYINLFDHEVLAGVSAMLDLTSRVFERLETTSNIDVDKRVAYMQCILRGAALNKYNAVMLECKQLAKYLTVDKWTLGDLKGLSTEVLWA